MTALLPHQDDDEPTLVTIPSPSPSPEEEADWVGGQSLEVWARDQPANEPLTPVQIENMIQWCQHHMTRGVGIVKTYQEAWLAAEKAYDQAYAFAYLRHDGPQTEKRQAATVDDEVLRLRDARDAAKVSYNYAQATLRRIEKELSGFQSLNKSMNAAYSGTTGYGS